MENYQICFGVTQTNDGKFATRNEWCRIISHNPIILALMTHYFGGDPEGIFGATPFEVLHQMLLGLLKYILESLYNYRPIPKDWESFFKKKAFQKYQTPTLLRRTRRVYLQ